MEDDVKNLEDQTPHTVDPGIILTNQTKQRVPIFKWNGEINFGNLLTIVTILLAAGALFFQKALLDTKVTELEIVIDSLESEKHTRVLSDLTHEKKMYDAFSYNLGFAVDQFRASNRLNSHEFTVLLTELNDIIDLLLKQKHITSTERKKLTLLKERNINKSEIYINNEIYYSKSIEFENANEPKEGDYKTIDEYIQAQQQYNHKLEKYINYLLNVQDNLTKISVENVRRTEAEYFKISK